MRGILITRLSELLVSFDKIEFAYLFGSHVDGSISKRSHIDVDIYVKGFDFKRIIDVR